MDICFLSRWAKELIDLKKCDVRRLVAKGVIVLQVQKYRGLEKIYFTITIIHLLLYRVIRNECRGFNNLSYTIHL